MDAWRLTSSFMNSIIGKRAHMVSRSSSSDKMPSTASSSQSAADPPLNKEEEDDNNNELVHHPEWPKPGVTRAEFNRARERHDVFSMLGMVPIMVFTVLDFTPDIFWRTPGTWWTPSPWFWHLWWSTALFTVADSIWIYRVPHSVRTPWTILEHHAVMCLYISAPLPLWQFACCMGPLMSVEINSFFSFCRRVAWKRGYKTAGDVFHILFLSSWILTRCIIYPALLLVFIRYGLEVIVPPFDRWVGGIPPLELPWIEYLPCLYFPVHVYFVRMNIKWTRDLFTPIVKKLYHRVRGWLGSDASTNKKAQ